MKKSRKFATFAASVLAVACMAVPLSNALPVYAEDNASITITDVGSVAHTFEAYQIFTGDISGSTLSNLKWGTGVSTYQANADSDATTVTIGGAVDATIVTAITAEGVDARSIISKFGLSETKSTATSSGGTASFTGLAPGYYLIKDTTNLSEQNDANSAYIVQVVGGTTTSIAIKNALPTVDKQVQDETGDAETNAIAGWGETADHAIGESFQFKLTATIPADADLKAYSTYKLVFHDTLSAGVTFESIESVTLKVADATSTTTIESGNGNTNYQSTATNGDANKEWTLTINDIKSLVGTNWGEKDVTVEVIYNAHLNEDATVTTASKTSATDNPNTVYLEYSNNPDSTGTGATGQTPTDTVWTFTYEVDNIKYGEDSSGQQTALPNAGFTLYADSVADGNKVSLAYNNTGKFYYPASGEGAVTEMTSASDGTFNIKGLDAGTYILKETTTPAGYNTCANTEIIISATHSENTDGNSAALTLNNTTKNMTNNIVNKSGSTLPTTGGIGTTIFYVGGGVVVAGAGVLLVTKKRMRNK